MRSNFIKKKITKKRTMATTVSSEMINRMGAVLTTFRKSMAASNRAFIRDLAKVINEQRMPRTWAFRKMVLALPTLEAKLNKIKCYYNPDYPAEMIEDRDLDGVSDWRPVLPEKRKKLLSRLTARINDRIQLDDDNRHHRTYYLPEEYRALLHHYDAVQDPNLRSIGVGGLHGSQCVWPRGESK